jgi:uncharacterized protein (DUF1499 family)
MPKTRGQGLARLALLVGIVSLVLLGVTGPGYRSGWLSLGTALRQLFAWGAYSGIAAMGLAGIALVWGRGPARRTAVLALVFGAASLYFPFRFQQAAGAVPAIHDITTDIVTPPQYVEVAALRRDLDVPNGLELPPETINQQIASYPDVQPLFLAAPPAEVYQKTLALVRARGWDVVADDPAGRRIEATATTVWFRFKDDVALRVSAMPDGTSRVDMRSVSRLGRSDIGTNARRIRDFLAELAR